MNQKTVKVIEAIGRLEFEPFEYGRLDCFLFAGRVVEIVHGTDYMARFDYDDIRGAARILGEFDGFSGLLDSLFGESQRAVDARDGDVVLIHRRGSEPGIENTIRSVGIASCGVGVFKTAGSVVEIPLSECSASWRVPETA